MTFITFLVSTLSVAAFLAGIALLLNKRNLSTKLQAGVCLLLGIHSFALLQIAATGTNGYPAFWIRLSDLWPLLLAFVVHQMLHKYGTPRLLPIALCKKMLYIPAVLFIIIGFGNPELSYKIFPFENGGGLLIPRADHLFAKLQFVWGILMGVFLLRYVLTKEEKNNSYFFLDIMLWCIPVAFLLLGKFTMPIRFNDLATMLWMPAVIPVAAGIYNAYKSRDNYIKTARNLLLPRAQIMIQTDEKGKILHTNSYTKDHLGCIDREISHHHISTIFPDIRISADSPKSKLTYMKKPNRKNIPVEIAINSMPGKQGFLITGTAIS